MSGAPQHAMSEGTRTLSLAEWMHTLEAPGVPHDESWRPTAIAIAPGQGAALRAASAQWHLQLHDTIDRQLHEMAQVRLPGERDASALDGEVRSLVDSRGGDRDAVGTWWHYPWDRRLVHLLGEADYFAVITNRNQDKLTAREQALLRTKRIGVIGLSVGGEAAVTVAQEHLCGEIWLADFDALDLSNLNRLGAGCDDLGVPKTTIVARRIAKLNPWLRVRAMHEGVTRDNVDEFVRSVDLVLEECDSLPIKGLVRQAARAHGTNVLYAADERGFVSIEPYADDPHLAPFLGGNEDAHRARSDFGTSQEFFVALTAWLGGWDRISVRSQQSLLKIGDTLRGYPQLASEARYAAGIVGHVARRLLLGERVGAWQGHLDLDTLIPFASGS